MSVWLTMADARDCASTNRVPINVTAQQDSD